jgi:hypothetical protein
VNYKGLQDEAGGVYYGVESLRCENIDIKLKNNDVHCTCDDVYLEHQKNPTYN